MPTLTTANLVAWSLQAAAIALAGGAGVRAAGLRSPRVRLAWYRALLVACLVLPFAQPVVMRPSGEPTRLASQVAPVRPGRVEGRIAADAAALSVDVARTTEREHVTQSAGPPRWRDTLVAVVPVVIGLGVVARLAWLMVGLVALGRLRRDTRPSGPDDAIGRAVDLVGARADIRISRAVQRPVTFGVLRPVVLLPGSFPSLGEAEQTAIVCHELLHVRRWHWLQATGEELVRAVLWFHPAIAWLLAQIDLAREQVVDRDVVALTERPQSYLNAIVTLALVPADPILRPASLFLGRAHLLQRVALLSREVRMSRTRLVASLVAITAVIVFGGLLVVHAFPLTAVAPAAPGLATASASPVVVLPAGAQTTARTAVPAPVPAVAGSIAERPASTVTPPQPQQTAEPQWRPVTLGAAQRVEPVSVAQSGQPGDDAIVVVGGTVDTLGMFVGPFDTVSFGGQEQRVVLNGSDMAVLESLLDRHVVSGGEQERMRAALDALRAWRFDPPTVPVRTAVGFNFARMAESGIETEPVRFGAGMAPPVRLRDVRPVYPADAQAKRIQGMTILETIIDGAGIPICAYAIRPIEGLTLAAIESVLQWRYTPDPNHSRRSLTVTVNFVLSSGGVAGGVEGGVRGGIAGGVRGGVAGGIAGGQANGTPPGTPTGPLRVGGNVLPPTRIKDVAPVVPEIARSARVQGVVILEIVIGTDGRVQDAKILRSIPLLDQAALDCVKQWEYTPTLLNGAPVPVIMTVTVAFTPPAASTGARGR